MGKPVDQFIASIVRRRMVAPLSLLAFMAAGTAAGQVAPPEPDVLSEIVVTGTQIRGVAPVGAPVVSVDQQEIIESGAHTAADILHDIPSVTTLGSNNTTLGANQNANLNTNRDSGINIRGLGTQATLTLLDGRRTPLGGSSGQLFDPSSIPTIAISNIDVVADGASAIYGSDAVAGVANILLRKDFEGLEVDSHYGTGSDYNTHELGAIFGQKWTNGSVMIAGQLDHNSQLTGFNRIGLLNCNETALGATLGCTTYGVPAGNIKVPAGASIPAGTYGLPVSATGTGITAAQLGAQNLYNPNNDLSLIPKSNRYSFVYNVHQELTDAISVWSEGYFTRNEISYSEGPYSATGKVTAANPGFIPLGSAVKSETVSLGLDPYVGPDLRSGYELAYQIAGGADVVLGGQWEGDFYYEHNNNHEYTDTLGINTTAEATAFACATPALCFDPFGFAPGNASAINSFIGASIFDYTQQQDLVNGKFDGPLFALPAGDVKLAVGFEIHHDTLDVYSHNTVNTPNTSVMKVAADLALNRTVGSAFAETVIPVIGPQNELPFVNRLDLNFAGRFDRYSDVGSTFNPKYALRWKPIPDLTIHADLGTSFRAPTLCDTKANCSGGTLAIPGVYGPGINVITLLGGNPALKPETARTATYGFDYKPSWVHGADFSMDFFHINYRNVIGTPAQNNPAALTNPIYAPFVIRNPTQAQINAITSQPFFSGGLTFPALQGSVNDIVLGTRSNSGAIITDGFDFSLGYNWSNAFGNWSVGGTGTVLFDYKYEVVAGAGLIERLDQANYPVSFHGRAKFGWNMDNVIGGDDNLSAIGYLNYTGAYSVVGLAYATQNTPVSAYTTVDMSLLYNLGKPGFGGGYADNITISLSIQNLFDAGPPFALITNAQEFDSQQASALGRLITVGIRKTF